jgi:RNA polymerase sigma-70 factor (ECF subfamily)
MSSALTEMTAGKVPQAVSPIRRRDHLVAPGRRYNLIVMGCAGKPYSCAVQGITDPPGPSAQAAADDAAEQAMLARLKAHDDQAFDELVRAWSPIMMRVARGFVSTDASAQEVVQEAWLGVIRGLGAFEGRSSVRTWVFRILTNVAKTRGVKEHRITPVSSLARDDDARHTVDPSRFRPDDDPLYPGNWTPAGRPQRWDDDPESGVLRGEIRTLVSAAVEALPDRQREVVVLRDVHGFDSDEVCSLLGVTPENQRVLLHRGRAQVRAALEQYYSKEHV